MAEATSLATLSSTDLSTRTTFMDPRTTRAPPSPWPSIETWITVTSTATVTADPKDRPAQTGTQGASDEISRPSMAGSSTTTSALGQSRSSNATTAIAISVSTTVPALLGAFCLGVLLIRKKRRTKVLQTNEMNCEVSAATETDGSPISELSDVKEAREVEDTGIRELDVPPVELEGDALAAVARPDDELTEGETWCRETLDAVLSTK